MLGRKNEICLVFHIENLESNWAISIPINEINKVAILNGKPRQIPFVPNVFLKFIVGIRMGFTIGIAICYPI